MRLLAGTAGKSQERGGKNEASSMVFQIHLFGVIHVPDAAYIRYPMPEENELNMTFNRSQTSGPTWDDTVWRATQRIGRLSRPFVDVELKLIGDDEPVCLCEKIHSLTKESVEAALDVQPHMIIFNAQNEIDIA